MAIDPAVAALGGAAIGGAISVVTAVITAWCTAHRERKAFERAVSQQEVDRVRGTYEHALNAFFTLERGPTPDPAKFGDVLAQLSLFGSGPVNDIFNTFLDMTEDRHVDLPALVGAMKDHISELEAMRVESPPMVVQ